LDVRRKEEPRRCVYRKEKKRRERNVAERSARGMQYPLLEGTESPPFSRARRRRRTCLDTDEEGRRRDLGGRITYSNKKPKKVLFFKS